MATAVRKIIEIDEEKCDGCGLCIPNCSEGALAIVDGKAKLVSDRFCDGLGACLGHCPQDAIQVIERPAELFDEASVELHLQSLGKDASDHASKHAAPAVEQPAVTAPHAGGGCPGSRMMDFREKGATPTSAANASAPSELRQWPVKINLVSPMAPYFQDAHLLVAADCAAFALGSFHADLLKDRAVAIGCPKFDDVGQYYQKLAAIIAHNDIKSVTVAHMEVPCCFSLAQAARQAVAASGKDIPVEIRVVGISGDLS